ncbi:TonB-dependent receptor domain-containing protein [Sulfurirhabdus autotrophica]|uniref:Vitamin B12 transporter n=1 Tax=Sulfurirhabdus autotrophica TaxID=1706046 RepID=A0A4R3XX08_9PROT|nr:TonB-dependent receptor [Sulfurirhabdus autotrophica]TCV84295.1 vitamin B12 transporter [Sulfurirhabdus autotrophica]
MKYPFKLTLISLALTGTAFADDITTFQGGDIIVTASRIPQKLSTSLQSTTVITSDDITKAGQQSLPELLQIKGNVEIKTTGGLGQQSAIFMRGANSTHTLILVDGVRLDNVTAGTTALEHIPLSQIERIEIVRAPASSLYGSDAIGGVIQIFTKNGKNAPGVSISAGVGSNQTQNLNAGFGSTFGNTNFYLQTGYLYNNTFSTTNAGAGNYYNPDRDPYRNTNLSAKIAHTLNADHEIGANIFLVDGTAHFDGYNSKLDDTKIQKLRTYSVYSQNQFTSIWQSLLKLNRGQDDYTFVNTAYPSHTRSDQDQITWQNDLSLDIGKVSVGLEYLKQHVDSTTTYNKTDRNVRSAFAVYQNDLGDHSIQASARRDNNSQFGVHDTGNLGYGYRFNPNWRMTAGAGTAFKAPNFQDLYYPGFSNPNLQPERSLGTEAGMHYANGHNRFDATYFENKIDDLIQYDSTLGYPINISKARITGMEAMFETKLAGVLLHANLTLQKPIDEITGKRLQNRATQFGSITLSKGFGAWTIGSELTGSDARFDSRTESSSSRMGGYGLINLTTSYKASKELTFNARINNVFNKGYELVKGYNTPGINLFVGLQYQPR